MSVRHVWHCAAGYGFRVLIYQFMKNNTTSERAAMEHLENITFLPGLEHEKFSMRMTEEEKAQRRIFYAEQFRKATQTAVQDGYDVLFFDEAMLIDFLKNKPEHLEVILTGRDPSPGLIELADYVSEIRKVKHPFDRGLPARRGIEC